jgi:hypothetical protein
LNVNETVTKSGRHFPATAEALETAHVPTVGKVSLDTRLVLGTTTMPVHQGRRRGRRAITELRWPRGAAIVSASRIAVEVKELLLWRAHTR